MTTADEILKTLTNMGLDIKQDGVGKYRMNSPFRPNSNSHAFTLTIEDDGEHGAYYDFNPKGDPEKGSLYDLAGRLGLAISPKAPPPPPPKTYSGLDDYAHAHGVDPKTFRSAGWAETRHHGRPALVFQTDGGERYRYLDGKKPKYWHKKGYRRSWYRLNHAIQQSPPLVICNGEASTVVAQAHGLAATTLTSGSEKPSIPDTMLETLRASYPTGQIIIALDCDTAGKEAAPRLAAFLVSHGYQARAVDLGLTGSQDLADFCRLHGNDTKNHLIACQTITPNETTRADGIKTAEFITALTSLGYKFRLNQLNDDVEVNGEPLSDHKAAEIRARMWDAGYTKYHRLMEDAYTYNASKTPYHPIKDYLENVNYDGQAHIDRLSRHFADRQNVFHLWLKKWLVGSVAKIYENYQNPMLILDGAQGRGKSYFARWLCPNDLHRHFVESAINPENNDHRILLATTWLWEVSELGSTTRKSDREALKAFITTQFITARKPYGKRPINKPTMASFIGTVNDEAGFLNDPTGSRRFLSCTLLEIDWDYTLLDIDNIWAEALYLYRSGYQYRLSHEEKGLQHDINEHYEIEDPWGAEVIRRYRITDNNDDFVAGADILIAIGRDALEIRNTMRLSRVMKKLGIEKTKREQPDGSRPNGYMGIVARKT